MQCKECYSENHRITPLNEAKKCLEEHRQYICSKCGRIICIDLDGERKARCFFPFSTKEMAILYLKCAEIITNSCCGIYELIYKRGDKRYKIFETENELNKFLEKNKDIRCENKIPVYKDTKFTKISPEQIRYLTKDEINKYLTERKEYYGRNDKYKRKKFIHKNNGEW
jgi:hypothetical protein